MQSHDPGVAGVVESKDDLIIIDEHRVQESLDQPLLAIDVRVVHSCKLIVRTNQIMVDTCDWLVCYVRHGASNSRKLLEYAKRRKEKGLIQIVNIGEREVGKE